MIPWYLILVAFLAIASLVYGLVALLLKHAVSRALLDIPNERSSHSVPTPRGGGLPVVLITLTSALVYGLVYGDWRIVGGYLIGGTLIAILGWRDDIRSLPARVRLVIHTLVAILSIAACGYFSALPFPFTPGIQIGAWGIPLTILWIVGLTNAYNFMDGIDGIAGGVALAAGLGWAFLLAVYLGGAGSLAFWLALAVAAGSLGFLGHNWQPARIFMGDVCSGFLGYTLAMLPLLVAQHPSQPWMAGVMLLWVFILDAGITFIRRFLRHERVFAAHRSHLYQQMVTAGFSHSAVSNIYILLTFLGILLAWGWVTRAPWFGWVILPGIPLFWVLFSITATRYKFFSSLMAYLSLGLHLGPDWLAYRVWFTLLNRLGVAKHQLPSASWATHPLSHWIKPSIPAETAMYHAWRMKNAPPWFFMDVPATPSDAPWDTRQAVHMAEQVLAGEWQYFGWQWLKTGFPPNWHVDPMSGKHFNPSTHFSQIPEYGDYDIKYAWEASRLNMIYPLLRAYASSADEKYAAAFWRLVEDWMEKNPPYNGVNWMGGQEAALRLLALCFGWYTFKRSPHTTAEQTAALTCLAGALARKLELSLPFAIHTGNNHAISESFGLWLCGTVFPELRGAEHYRTLGQKHFVRQAMRQLFLDGSYSMYSTNYQRFVLQLAALAIRLAELQGQPLPAALNERLSHSTDFLLALMDKETGKVPVFGSNDGALILPLDGCDFSDYRPTLQLLSFVSRNVRALHPGPWDEASWWILGESALQLPLVTPPAPSTCFPDAGITLLQDPSSRVYLRAVKHRNRPSHADQLHMDLWVGKFNLALDAGTYLYHGADPWQNGLAHTAAHNTVSVDATDQMHWLSRFTWAHWSTGKVLHQDDNSWLATHNGYARLGDPVRHTRQVRGLGEGMWLVIDQLDGHQAHDYRLHWLLADGKYHMELGDGYQVCHLDYPGNQYHIFIAQMAGAVVQVERAVENSTAGWHSTYFGEKSPAISLSIQVRSPATFFATLFTATGKELAEEQIKQLLHTRIGVQKG
jgi:asparagine synthase (glutamine-hydrolysing)